MWWIKKRDLWQKFKLRLLSHLQTPDQSLQRVDINVFGQSCIVLAAAAVIALGVVCVLCPVGLWSRLCDGWHSLCCVVLYVSQCSHMFTIYLDFYFLFYSWWVERLCLWLCLLTCLVLYTAPCVYSVNLTLLSWLQQYKSSIQMEFFWFSIECLLVNTCERKPVSPYIV